MSRVVLCLVGAALLLTGCGAGRATPARGPGTARVGTDADRTIPASLRAGLRPIGRGPRFQPPIGGVVTGPCTSRLGPRLPAHIEVFGADQVVLLPSGIGTAGPRHFRDGRLTSARCFADAVTLDATGIVYFRAGIGITLGAVFRAWGEPLTGTRVASFRGGGTQVYVDGRLWHGAPSALPLTPGAEIVVEIGPHVPPHTRFVFPPPPSPLMR